jgi:hypothetical protein
MRIGFLRVVLIFGFAALSAQAQENRGAILGRATDPSGAVVPNVRIRVTNVETSATLEASTNDEGNYQAPFLLPGTYRLTAEHAGFKEAVQGGIQVQIGASVTVNLSLEMGTSSETVTVNGGAPLLETTGSDLGQSVPSNYVRDVGASFYRNAANFVRLAPGVTGQSMGTYTSDNQTAVSISGGGAIQGGNEWIIDGVSDTVPLSTGSVVLVPTVDSVEEMKVNTTMFDAAYGHSNGGAITITTKGGTNNLHGTAYLFKRWAALYANTWQNDKNGVAKPSVNYHEWGYFLSGPVYIPKVYNGKNKTFFSTWLSSDFDTRDLNELARVPTALERQGNFSQTLAKTGGGLITIYNPFSTVVTGSKATRTAFPGSIIPASLINPIGQAAMNLLPLPNLVAAPQIGGNNWYEDANYFVGQKQESGRLDHYFGEKNRVFGRYSRLTRDQYADALIPGVHQYNGSGSNLDTYLQWRTSVNVNDTYTFSPTLVGTFSYGFARRVNNDSYGGYGFDPSALHLPSVIVNNQVVKGYPEFNLGENVPSIGSRINLIANNSHSFFATFTKIRGNHTLKFGTDYRILQYNTASQGTSAAGSFTFNSTFTQSDPYTASTGNTTGTAMASELLGVPASGSFGYTSPLSLQGQYVGAFVEDAWKITPKLTINLGIRYELETPYHERYNRVAWGFTPAAAFPIQVPGLNLHGGIQFAGVNGNSASEGNLDTNNFGPRFGFAYQLFRNTVLRGGYGLFFSPMLDNTSDLGTFSTFSPTTPYVASTDSGATPYTTLTNPFPNGLQSVVGSSLGLASQAGNSITYLNQNRVAPYNQQWQFSVQHQLPSQIVVEAAYVGMLSVKEFESYNLNDLPDVYLPLGAAQNTAVPNPFYGVFPSNSTLGSGTTVSQKQFWLAYPQFSSLTIDADNTGVTTYNALQTRVEKRLTHGLTVVSTFTFSKLMRNNMTSVVNTRHYRSISSLDQPKLFRLAVAYAIPLHFAGSGYQRLLREVAGDWAVTGYLTMESGLPLSISQANGRPIVVGNPQESGPIDQRLGDRVVGGVAQNPYFNTGAFQALATQYTVSPQVPYISQLRAPGLCALNASLFKNFAIYERLHAELRLEAYNATNHPFFNSPGTNMSTTATFGVITGASNSRSMQAGLKVIF